MPITQKLTKKQIRQNVGITLGAINQDDGLIESVPSEESPTVAQIVDDALAFGGADEYRGWWVVGTDSAGTVAIRRIFESSPDDRSLTMSVGFASKPNSSWTYEMWAPDMPPTAIHGFIDQAITEVTLKQSISVTSDSLHMGGNIRRFGLDSAMTGVREVEYRNRFSGKNLLSFDNAMSSLTSNVTPVSDTSDLREGSAASKITVAAGESSATSFAASSFGSEDISGTTQAEYWFKSNVVITSSAYNVILLNGSSVRETLNVPALNADSWTHITTNLANPELDTDITTVQLATGSSDGGSATIWTDDLKAVRGNAEWHRKVPRKFWSVDKDNRELVLSADANIGYKKLHITGMRKPALLTSDSQVSDVNSQYIVNSVVAKALRQRGDRTASGRDAAYEQADRYEALAQQARQRGGVLANIRWLSD